MGLFERALNYKKKLNSQGKETLIDKIQGPASTSFVNRDLKKAPADDEIEVVPMDREVEPDPILRLSKDDMVEIEIGEDGMPNLEALAAAMESGRKGPYPPLSGDNLKEYSDNQILVEILKDIMRSEDHEALYDVVAFSIMGQVAVSSVSVLTLTGDNELSAVYSAGVRLTEPVSWKTNEGLFKEVADTGRITDADDYKDNVDFNEDYLRILSVDGKMIVPCCNDEALSAAFLLGEKIDGTSFSEMELTLLSYLSQLFPISYERIRRKAAEMESLQQDISSKEIYDYVESFQHGFSRISTREELTELSRQTFRFLGVEIFSLFLYDFVGEHYALEFCEENNILGLDEKDIKFPLEHKLLGLLKSQGQSIGIENFADNKILQNLYGTRVLAEMEVFQVYPFFVGGDIPGFIIVNKLAQSPYGNVEIRLSKIVRALVPAFRELLLWKNDSIKSGKLDGKIYDLLNNSCRECEKIGIPFSIAKLSFTNTGIVKRELGLERAFEMLRTAEKIISKNLSKHEFIFKLGVDRYIIALPGKDKKYIANMAAALTRAIHEETELNLLYLAVSAGEDGNDVFDLLNILN